MIINKQFKDDAKSLCEQFGIKKLSVFGSVARGDERKESDIDFLAEFDSPTPVSMPERYFGFIREASARFNRNIQVMTPGMIRNPHLKRSIDRDLKVVHE